MKTNRITTVSTVERVSKMQVMMLELFSHLSVSFPGIRESLESSDLIINIGTLQTDSNTGGFTRNLRDGQLVMLGHDTCSVHGEEFSGIHFLPVLARIVKELKGDPAEYGLPFKSQDTQLSVSSSIDCDEMEQSLI